uniref:LysR family transcriptional regulator n=1 Tax=Marinobacterium profundum TaxID=1714300 RepID=UPI000836CF17|nr:LysR family transcriptional regulator [Marinobacterium profundum]
MKHLQPLHYINAVAKAGSIRKAAETLTLTSTALNRRILAMEEELGYQIFERMPQGVRLSAAGEIFIHHIRTQLTDMERVKSQIADLSGERRGHVSIACSQAMLSYFLPEQVSQYRGRHPAVTFEVLLRDRAAAEEALTNMTADLAIVFEPVRLTEFQVLLTVRQPVHAVMRSGHPLAQSDKVRLRDCLRFPISLPSTPYGVRNLLEMATRRTSSTLNPMVESDSFEFLHRHAIAEDMITFQIPIGLPMETLSSGMVSRPVDERDVPAGSLYIGQLKSRILPVAASRFSDQIIETFLNRYVCT